MTTASPLTSTLAGASGATSAYAPTPAPTSTPGTPLGPPLLLPSRKGSVNVLKGIAGGSSSSLVGAQRDEREGTAPSSLTNVDGGDKERDSAGTDTTSTMIQLTPPTPPATLPISSASSLTSGSTQAMTDDVFNITIITTSIHSPAIWRVSSPHLETLTSSSSTPPPLPSHRPTLPARPSQAPSSGETPSSPSPVSVSSSSSIAGASTTPLRSTQSSTDSITLPALAPPPPALHRVSPSTTSISSSTGIVNGMAIAGMDRIGSASAMGGERKAWTPPVPLPPSEGEFDSEYGDEFEHE
ncbi:hypothetical protein M422DRAFT_252915 [Sphaerobolus stellatus SS14]|uniref:Uncharacterized protein n=1 Tax=Sphaerobolus stellatus (strain SS14) TaxID=990650 RepID=A0A0C9V9L3_SPHS4|nr:hypothetical protein M422DRAFT_252915 [Sphaerobolus stellatus SS14]